MTMRGYWDPFSADVLQTQFLLSAGQLGFFAFTFVSKEINKKHKLFLCGTDTDEVACFEYTIWLILDFIHIYSTVCMYILYILYNICIKTKICAKISSKVVYHV